MTSSNASVLPSVPPLGGPDASLVDAPQAQAVEPEPASASKSIGALRVAAGLHEGADRPLAAQEMILIGNGDDCDIILADAGVARRHAMVMVFDGEATVRALDAPLLLDGRTVRPGDPVALEPGQRITLGGAVLAACDASATAGDRDAGPGDHVPAPEAAPSRRLHVIAAVAALSLVSMAIFAAVVPAPEAVPGVEERLNALIAEYGVTDGRVTVDAEGLTSLSGTVEDAAARQAIQQRLQAEGIVATVDLRTGDDIASDVREVLRTQGLMARTRYLGNGDVEVTGRFEDEAALRAAATSRAMIDVVGVNRVIPRNLVTTPPQAPAPTPPVPVRIVAIVRGAQPYVVASDGKRYAPGATLPGDAGALVGIGEHAWVLVDGEVRRMKVQPSAVPPGTFANVMASYARH